MLVKKKNTFKFFLFFFNVLCIYIYGPWHVLLCFFNLKLISCHVDQCKIHKHLIRMWENDFSVAVCVKTLLPGVRVWMNAPVAQRTLALDETWSSTSGHCRAALSAVGTRTYKRDWKRTQQKYVLTNKQTRARCLMFDSSPGRSPHL